MTIDDTNAALKAIPFLPVSGKPSQGGQFQKEGNMLGENSISIVEIPAEDNATKGRPGVNKNHQDVNGTPEHSAGDSRPSIASRFPADYNIAIFGRE